MSEKRSFWQRYRWLLLVLGALVLLGLCVAWLLKLMAAGEEPRKKKVIQEISLMKPPPPPPPPPPPIATPPPPQPPAPNNTPPADAVVLPPITADSPKTEAPPAGYLNLVGVYPLPGVNLERQAILYLSEAAVCPPDKDGNEQPPVTLEPRNVKADCALKDNYIVLNFGDALKNLPMAFVRITLNPALKIGRAHV